MSGQSNRMDCKLVAANVVIAAHHFNPSVFSQVWLLKHRIMSEDDFLQGCLFSDQAVSVEAKQFSLLVVPPQLQFAPKVAPEDQQALVVAKVGTIAETLPHTPFSGVGLNFLWHVQPEGGDIVGLTRSLFYMSDKPICGFFNSEDSRYGAYFSKDTLGCRLKLDIKPALLPTPEGLTEILLFAFNFHRDLAAQANETATAISEHLGQWNAAKELAKEIAEATIPN